MATATQMALEYLTGILVVLLGWVVLVAGSVVVWQLLGARAPSSPVREAVQRVGDPE